MVFYQDTEDCKNMAEMDKILEEFLMPPPDSIPRNLVLRNSTDSLRDGSSSSLDRSNNSSSSWNSSCSCHSMSSLNHSGTRSTFVFNKHPILPPLLCSSSRIEMKIYKMKAVEKEQQRKQKEKHRLISRVEAILSSVEVSPAKMRRHKDGEKSIEDVNVPSDETMKHNSGDVTPVHVDEESIHCDISSFHEDDFECHENSASNHNLSGSHDSDSRYSNHSHTSGSQSDSDHHSNHEVSTNHHGNPTDPCTIHPTPAIKDGATTSSDESDDDVTSFHDNAYRSSLRNLLQKSMSLNQSGTANVDKNASQQGTTGSKSNSESDEDITEDTVIDTRADPPTPSDPDFTESDSNSLNSPSEMEENDLLSEEETLVESIVESVLTKAKNEILNENNPESLLLCNTPPCDVITSEEDMESRLELENKTIRPENHITNEILTWGTPRVKEKEEGPEGNAHVKGEETEESPFSVTSSQFFELHNQSTSTKVDVPLGVNGEHNWEEQVNKKFTALCHFEPTAVEESPILPTNGNIEPICPVGGDKEQNGHDGVPSKISVIVELPPLSGLAEANFPLDGAGDNIKQKMEAQHEESPIHSPYEANSIVELSGTLCYDNTVSQAYPPHAAYGQVSMATVIDHLTVLQPAMSDTTSDVTSMTSSEVDDAKVTREEMKENYDPSLETGPLSPLKRSLSYTLNQPSRTFESAVIEAVSQHFQGFQENETDRGVKAADEIVAAKKLLHARVRRGSYTLDEPSPYLVKNKESLTIKPLNLDDDACSEITADTGLHDVKRKLDLPSDSEESSIPVSAKKGNGKENGSVSNAELSVVNLCRILQDQHKQQMEIMKLRHHDQLENLQKELVHGQTRNKMSLPLDGAINPCVAPPHDVTVSPSLASTEYQDIRIGGRHLGQFPTEYTNADPRNDVVSYQESDVSRITDVELTSSLHEKLCKFSALCKGHLTRRLLRSNKVQEILQIIRDTSRLILSLHTEINESKGMDSIRDTDLEDRLFTQLRSVMHDLHDIFFNISTGERMYIIAQSCILEKMAEKLPKTHKSQKLSAATQKSLERKRLLSSNSPPQLTSNHRKVMQEIKSKISHIWKPDPTKPLEKKSPPVKLPSNSTNHVKKQSSKSMTSQSKAKSPVMSHTKPSTLSNKPITSSLQVTSPSKAKSPTKSQNQPEPPQAKTMASSRAKTIVTSQSKMRTSQAKTVTSSQPVTSQSKTSRPGKLASKPKPSSVKSAPARTKPAVSPLTSHSGSNVMSQRKTVTSQTDKPQAQKSKGMQRKISQGKKPAPLSNVNKANIPAKP